MARQYRPHDGSHRPQATDDQQPRDLSDTDSRADRLRDEVDGWLAEWFGLSEREIEWIRLAKAENSVDGYSEALLCVDELGRFPIQVRTSDAEAAVIE